MGEIRTGAGTTVHRADCDLVAGREDLHPAGPDAPHLTPCRLCHLGCRRTRFVSGHQHLLNNTVELTLGHEIRGEHVFV